jgi:hypothetical protein
MTALDLILLEICTFALGWVLNDLAKAPTLLIVAACVVAQIGILVLKTKRGKK